MSQVDVKLVDRFRSSKNALLEPNDVRVKEIVNSSENSKLTNQQRVAVASALTNRLTLIQGTYER